MEPKWGEDVPWKWEVPSLCVVGVALLLPSGALLTRSLPHRHHHLIQDLHQLNPEASMEHVAQGFLLSDGTYASRKRAWDVAKAAGQLMARAPTDKRGGTLYSEDVW